jgi:hypothetical protein
LGIASDVEVGIKTEDDSSGMVWVFSSVEFLGFEFGEVDLRESEVWGGGFKEEEDSEAGGKA